MRDQVIKDLSVRIGEAIDAHLREVPDLTTHEVLAAVERMRRVVTEQVIEVTHGSGNVR